MSEKLHIIGGGMAGSEAAWQAAQMGVRVVLHEMRPEVGTFLIQAQEQALNLVANSFEQQITAQKNTLAEMCQKASTSNRDEFIAAAQEAQSKLKALGKAYL